METVSLLNIGKEVVFQHFGDFRQLNHIHGRTLEDAIDGGALQMDSPRKLRYAHPALVEDGFDHLSDVEVLRRGHDGEVSLGHKKGVEVNLA